ncbi:MAG TPA: alpha/beta hydrolase domain-containing protein [Chloroflexota bacterium]|nr:alpha/beta hydrolase domain-containing protein [Chloroflexota bacterium]
MSVSHLEVARRSPFASDYERIDGKLHFAVDPAHPANARITDLDKASRDDQGKVRFWADFILIQPAAVEGGNRRLLYLVVNRGGHAGLPFNRFTPRLPTLPPTDEIDPGDGFLMRRGWSVLMVGWQWDTQRQPGLIGLDAPQALGPDHQPLQGKVCVAFQPNEAHPVHHLSHWPLHPPPAGQPYAHQPYNAADVNEPTAVLYSRPSRMGPRTVIPREQWRFARLESGQPVSDDAHVCLAAGFQPGTWYEVVYTTRVCPVVGTGLLATRDSVSWLRYDQTAANPAAGRIDYTYATGRSQSGRFLRQFLYDGLNVDEAGRQVFDGLNPHVAGARLGEFNQRFGQPSETNPLGFGGLYPFASDTLSDPLTGRTDGLLERQRALGGLPKIFSTNTSSEYWRVDCSLTHTDPSGTRDVEPPAEERIYLVAGHQHGSGVAALGDTTPIGARGANTFNMVDGSTVLRAFLINLDRWVSEGVEPPPSEFPRLADGTAVSRETVLAQFATYPGMTVLDRQTLPTLRRLDLGPDTARGIARLPERTGEPYPSFVSAVDADGNEIAGIRLPDLTVPVASHTGWVARHPSTGGAGQSLDMMGTSLPLPQTETQRREQSDPRLSIAERYRDREAYVEQARQAALRLVEARHLLSEDVDLVVELAAKRYDVVAPRTVVASR